MSKTVSELLVGVLQQVGVKQIFGLIGDSARLHGHERHPAFTHKHPRPRLYQEPTLLPIS